MILARRKPGSRAFFFVVMQWELIGLASWICRVSGLPPNTRKRFESWLERLALLYRTREFERTSKQIIFLQAIEQTLFTTGVSNLTTCFLRQTTLNGSNRLNNSLIWKGWPWRRSVLLDYLSMLSPMDGWIGGDDRKGKSKSEFRIWNGFLCSTPFSVGG